MADEVTKESEVSEQTNIGASEAAPEQTPAEAPETQTRDAKPAPEPVTAEQLEKFATDLRQQIEQGRTTAPAATPQIDVEDLYNKLIEKQQAAIAERAAYEANPTDARLAKLEKTLSEITGGLSELKANSAAAARVAQEQQAEAQKRAFDSQMAKQYPDWNEHRDGLWATSAKHPTLTADEVYALYKATAKVAPKPQAKVTPEAVRRAGTERPTGLQPTAQRPAKSITTAVQEAFEEVSRNQGLPK